MIILLLKTIRKLLVNKIILTICNCACVRNTCQITPRDCFAFQKPVRFAKIRLFGNICSLKMYVLFCIFALKKYAPIFVFNYACETCIWHGLQIYSYLLLVQLHTNTAISSGFSFSGLYNLCELLRSICTIIVFNYACETFIWHGFQIYTYKLFWELHTNTSISLIQKVGFSFPGLGIQFLRALLRSYESHGLREG